MRALSLAILFGLAACSDAIDETEKSDCSGIEAGAMVAIEGGTFMMGQGPRYPEEGPPRSVSIDGFSMAATEVTNARFARFVEETGYITLAERAPPAMPGAPPEMMQPGSAVFKAPSADDPNWWAWVPGAHWRHPSGPDSDIAGRGNEPVVQVAYDDALAFAEWAGAALPSEAQWEYAASAGADAFSGPDAGEANTYQGAFPAKDLGEDGFTSRAPVGCFPANENGLHDMLGNVWEWTTSDAGHAGAAEPVKVIKGGSYLCAENYCARYRPAARQFQERGLGTNHIGFRVVSKESGR